MLEIEAALEPPNLWDPLRREPVWWAGDDDAWSEFQRAARN